MATNETSSQPSTAALPVSSTTALPVSSTTALPVSSTTALPVSSTTGSPASSTTGSPASSTTIDYTRRTTVMSKEKDIFHAIKRNDLAAVKQCVEEKNEPITKQDGEKRTGAMLAAELGHLDILKYFLDKNSTLLTVEDWYGNTVMERAIQKGDLNMVKYLVDDKKANITAIEHHIHTAVHVAALEGQLPILKYFVEDKKADVNLRNLNGETPLFSAAEKPFIFIVMYLIEERHADPTLVDLTNDNLLFKSARHGDITVPKYILDTKKIPLDINYTNKLGYTIVNWASKYNQTEFVKFMVTEKKADVNLPDTKMKRTPLHRAAMESNVALCTFLVEHKANLDAKDVHGETPAQLATIPEVATLLNSTKTSRKRRSLTETMNVPAARQDVPMWRSMVGNEHRYQGIASGDQGANLHITVTGNLASLLDIFLKVVDTAVRYARGLPKNEPVEHQSLESPQENLRRRMDPFAVDAVHQLVDFEE